MYTFVKTKFYANWLNLASKAIDTFNQTILKFICSN